MTTLKRPQVPAPQSKRKKGKKPSQDKEKSPAKSSSSSSSSDTEEESSEEERPKKKKSKKRSRKVSSGSEDIDLGKAIAKGFKMLSKSASKKKKRSSSSGPDSDSPEEEETKLIEKTYTVKDDGVAEVNMEIRHALRTPTGEPSAWWKAPFRSRVSRPIRGSGLNTEAAMGYCRVHDATIRVSFCSN